MQSHAKWRKNGVEKLTNLQVEKSTTTLRKHKDEHGLYKRAVLIFFIRSNASVLTCHRYWRDFDENPLEHLRSDQSIFLITPLGKY